MRAFVTGGAGCIGSELVKRLIERGYVVTVFDNLSSGKEEHIEEFLNNKNFRFIEGDILDRDLLESSMAGCDVVFHLAANPDIKFILGDPTDKDLRQNTLGTYNVLEAMRKNSVKNILFSSSSVVYGWAKKIPTPEDYGPLETTSLYGASKAACETLISSYCHMFGIRGWIFRFANIVGEKSRKKGRTVISDFIYKLQQNPTHLEILGDGKQTKSYMLVDECVDGMLFAFENAKDQVNVFNLGTIDSIDVNKIAEIVTSEMGLSGVRLSYTGTKGGWIGDITNFRLDTRKLAELGWKARYGSADAVRISAKRMLKN